MTKFITYKKAVEKMRPYVQKAIISHDFDTAAEISTTIVLLFDLDHNEETINKVASDLRGW